MIKDSYFGYEHNMQKAEVKYRWKNLPFKGLDKYVFNHNVNTLLRYEMQLREYSIRTIENRHSTTRVYYLFPLSFYQIFL